MKKFTFSVSDGFFPITFEGEIEAETKKAAITELKEVYAVELDTIEDLIRVKLQEIQ